MDYRMLTSFDAFLAEKTWVVAPICDELVHVSIPVVLVSPIALLDFIIISY